MGGICLVEAGRHRESLWEGLDLLQVEGRDGELGVKGSDLGLADLQS